MNILKTLIAGLLAFTFSVSAANLIVTPTTIVKENELYANPTIATQVVTVVATVTNNQTVAVTESSAWLSCAPTAFTLSLTNCVSTNVVVTYATTAQAAGATNTTINVSNVTATVNHPITAWRITSGAPATMKTTTFVGTGGDTNIITHRGRVIESWIVNTP